MVMASILFVRLIALLVHLQIENRRCVIARNFKEYCIKCEEMLNKSGKHGAVMTIQTPVQTIPADAMEAFESYMSRTFEILISTSCQYHRLVVLEADDAMPETRIKDDFIKKLIQKAKEKERSTRGNTSFDLRNVHIGFVSAGSVQDSIYSNIDIHCTTDKDFSIAFMAKQARRGRDFGSSLHLHDFKTTLSKLIQGDFQAHGIWRSQQTLFSQWEIIIPIMMAFPAAKKRMEQL